MSLKIKISTDFSDAPGARFISDGPNSGELFYTTILRDKFAEALQQGVDLEVDLNDVWGYPSSFVSGSFGELAKLHGSNVVLEKVKFISGDNPMHETKIMKEIEKHPKK